MAQNLGEWIVRLAADGSALVTGLQSAAQTTQSFANRAKEIAGSVASSVNTALKAITKVDMSAQMKQMVDLASSVGTLAGDLLSRNWGGALASATGLATSMIGVAQASLSAVSAQVGLTRQIGITVQEAAGLQLLARRQSIDPEMLTSGLTGWVRRLGDLRHEMSSGQGSAGANALARMGIDAREFMAMNVPQQFAAIADGARRIPDVLDRQATIVAVIGRRAANLTNLFREQGSTLSDLSGVAASFGYNLSTADAEQIATAARGLRDLGAYVAATFDHIGRGLGLVFAPVVMIVSATLRELVQHARPLINLIGVGLASVFAGLLMPIVTVATAVRVAMPLFRLMGNVVEWAFGRARAMGAGLMQVGSAIYGFFSPLIEGFRSFWDAVAGGASGIWDEFVSGLREFGSAALDVWNAVVLLYDEIVTALGIDAKSVIYELRFMIVDFALIAGRSLRIVAAMVREVADTVRHFTSTIANGIRTAASWVRGDSQTSAASAAASEANLVKMTWEQVNQVIAAAVNRSPAAAWDRFNTTLRTTGNLMTAAVELQQSFVSQTNPNAGTAEASEAVANLQNELRRRIMAAPVTGDRFGDELRRIQSQLQAAGATSDQIFATLGQARAAQAVELHGEFVTQNQALVDQYETIGMTAREAELYRLEMRGATAEMLQQRSHLHDLIEAERDRLRLQQEGQRTIEQTATPLERFQSHLSDLQVMFNHGAIDAQTFDRSAIAAFEQLERGFQSPQHGGPAAALQGSLDAARAISQANRDERDRARDPMERLQRIQEQARLQLQNINQNMGEFLRLARDGFVEVLD